MTFSIQPFVAIVVAAEEAAASEEGTFNPILPTLPDIIWSAICFFALWALMKYVLLPPIVQGRDRRRALVAAGDGSVSDTEAELAKLTAAHEERLAGARAEAADILEAARLEADAQRSEVMGAVDEKVAVLRSDAQSEIDQARTKALQGARGTVSDLAVDAAGRVLGTKLDAGSVKGTLDAFLSGQGTK